MELQSKQKKIAYAFGIFMVFMFLCTLISRAIYASGLPQVSAEKPERKNIAHKVQAEGIVQPGMEYALNILSGLRCHTVHVHVGDRVTPETLLFEIDTQDLEEQIQEQELTIQKLQLTIQDQEYNRKLDAQRKQTESERAEEDYSRAKQEEGSAVHSAEEDLSAAEEAYDTAKANYEEHMANPVEEPEPEPEHPEGEENEEWQTKYEEWKEKKEEWETQQKAWEEKKSSLEEEMEHAGQALDAARKTLEEAENGRSDTLLEAKRRADDTKAPSQADSSPEMNRLELSSLQRQLEKYKKILKSEGKIYAEEAGIITKIGVSPGERIADGAAIVYADQDSPLQFCFSLTKEEKRYVNLGDRAKLTIEGTTVDVTVDYVQQSEGNLELYDVTVFLPEGVGTVNQSGTFECEWQSQKYSCVIPIDALNEDQNRRKFVYILSERSGILGMELIAEQVYVKVLDQNDSYAALEEGSIDSDTELIVSSTKALEDRAVVRYKE